MIARSLEETDRFTVKIGNVEWAEYGKKRRDGEMPELVHTEQRVQDPAPRADALRNAQAYMAEQVPYIPLFQAPQFAAAADKLSGVVLDPI